MTPTRLVVLSWIFALAGPVLAQQAEERLIAPDLTGLYEQLEELGTLRDTVNEAAVAEAPLEGETPTEAYLQKTERLVGIENSLSRCREALRVHAERDPAAVAASLSQASPRILEQVVPLLLAAQGEALLPAQDLGVHLVAAARRLEAIPTTLQDGIARFGGADGAAFLAKRAVEGGDANMLSRAFGTGEDQVVRWVVELAAGGTKHAALALHAIRGTRPNPPLVEINDPVRRTRARGYVSTISQLAQTTQSAAAKEVLVRHLGFLVRIPPPPTGDLDADWLEWLAEQAISTGGLLVQANPDAEIHASATWLLGQVRHPEAYLILEEVVIDDRFPRSQAAAAYALGLGGQRQAVPSLIDAMESENPRLVQACVKALQQISRKRFGAEAPRWRAWWALQPEGRESGS